jgi:hypothetical protein
MGVEGLEYDLSAVGVGEKNDEAADVVESKDPWLDLWSASGSV